jgi:hypothetical protein
VLLRETLGSAGSDHHKHCREGDESERSGHIYRTESTRNVPKQMRRRRGDSLRDRDR